MHLEQLRHHLEALEYSRPLLQSWKVRDVERGWRNLSHIAGAAGVEALHDLCPALGRLLPRCPDPDMALNNLERFLADPAGRESLPVLLEGRARSLEILLQLLSTSQFFSDLLVANPGYLDMLRVPLRRSPSQKEMQDQLQSEIDAAFEDSAVLRAFRRFRQRQTLRIGTNDIIRDRPLEEITRDISRVAHGKHVIIGRVPNFIDDLKRGSLLSGDPIRVNRIHDDKIAALAQLPHNPERIVKVAVNGNDFCAVSKSLQQFASRNLSRRQNYRAGNSRPRCISSRGGRSISG